MIPPAPEPSSRSSRLIRGRGPRWPSGSARSILAGVISLSALCCGLTVVQLILRLGTRQLIDRIGWLALCGLTIAALALFVAAVQLQFRTARRALNRWATSNGWEPVAGRTVWPWTAAQPSPDAVTVRTAIEGVVGGHPMIVGEVSWLRDGLGGSVDRSHGSGIFAIVNLPSAYPRTSVQARRSVGRLRPGEDEFARRFRIVIDEPLTLADRVTAPELQAAHVNGTIPPWTIAGNELYAVIPTRRLLRPGLAVALTHQMLFLVGLLLGDRDDT